ncbi:DUF2274 domain-containing protein [Bradyrhizobium sp. SRL28]|uniref:DUF2274 domain-containing protein n=1 Tax=Bradyrhizobium sp. SRL28 TaxID=2836178 RepID=UPI0035AFDEDD
MAKLKLGAIADDKPVKLTVELPADVHRDLAAYTDMLTRETGQSISDPAKLVAPMLARFMAQPTEPLQRPAARVSLRKARIALAQQFEEVCQRRIVIVLAPMC